MADSSVANAAKESAQAEFSHGLPGFSINRVRSPLFVRTPPPTPHSKLRRRSRASLWRSPRLCDIPAFLSKRCRSNRARDNRIISEKAIFAAGRRHVDRCRLGIQHCIAHIRCRAKEGAVRVDQVLHSGLGNWRPTGIHCRYTEAGFRSTPTMSNPLPANTASIGTPSLPKPTTDRRSFISLNPLTFDDPLTIL
jgi:hypothetical protein